MRRGELIANLFLLFGPALVGLLVAGVLARSSLLLAVLFLLFVLGVVLLVCSNRTDRRMRKTQTLGCLALLVAVPVTAVLLFGQWKRNARQQYERHLEQSMTKQFDEIKQGKSSQLYLYTLSNFADLLADPADAARVESIDVMMWPDVSDPRWSQLKKLPNLKRIHFYDCGNVSPVLTNIRGMRSLEQFLLSGGTPLSDAGMACVPSFGNLKELYVFGPVTNAGLAQLRGHGSLEDLKLIMTDVTDDGLAALKDLPRLRRLTIEWDPQWASRRAEVGLGQGAGPTDAATVHLKQLTNLESMELNGGWVSEPAIEKMRKALPNCKITASPEACYE